jgi:integrin alpha FG-GAP repeat containing protein 1
MPTLSGCWLSLLLLCLISSSTAIWPFPSKRYTGDSLLGTGSMGIGDNDGERIVAFGDFNGDQ